MFSLTDGNVLSTESRSSVCLLIHLEKFFGCAARISTPTLKVTKKIARPWPGVQNQGKWAAGWRSFWWSGSPVGGQVEKQAETYQTHDQETGWWRTCWESDKKTCQQRSRRRSIKASVRFTRTTTSSKGSQSLLLAASHHLSDLAPRLDVSFSCLYWLDLMNHTNRANRALSVTHECFCYARLFTWKLSEVVLKRKTKRFREEVSDGAYWGLRSGLEVDIKSKRLRPTWSGR